MVKVIGASLGYMRPYFKKGRRRGMRKRKKRGGRLERRRGEEEVTTEANQADVSKFSHAHTKQA